MIILQEQLDCITATYDLQDEQHAEILRLFGTATIPTAFTPDANRTEVIREIKRLNPGAIVTWSDQDSL